MKMWAQWSCVLAIEETMYYQVLMPLSRISILVGTTRSITAAMSLLCVH